MLSNELFQSFATNHLYNRYESLHKQYQNSKDPALLKEMDNIANRLKFHRQRHMVNDFTGNKEVHNPDGYGSEVIRNMRRYMEHVNRAEKLDRKLGKGTDKGLVYGRPEGLDGINDKAIITDDSGMLRTIDTKIPGLNLTDRDWGETSRFLSTR